MSYDIDLDVDHHDGYKTTVHSANITYNVRPMLVAAGLDDSLWSLDGKAASEIADLVSEVYRNARKDVNGTISRLESPNGWGLYKHLIPWLKDFYTAVRTHPNAIVRVY